MALRGVGVGTCATSGKTGISGVLVARLTSERSNESCDAVESVATPTAPSTTTPADASSLILTRVMLALVLCVLCVRLMFFLEKPRPTAAHCDTKTNNRYACKKKKCGVPA